MARSPCKSWSSTFEANRRHVKRSCRSHASHLVAGDIPHILPSAYAAVTPADDPLWCLTFTCTIPQFEPAPHAYLRSARAPIPKFWSPGSAHGRHCISIPDPEPLS
eukprot:6190277-Pleurochrysis_carterae.AAC.2